MIRPEDFLQALKKNGIHFFAGVPDSLMKGFLGILQAEDHHFITANEGAAIAFASGYYLSTGQTGLVYMQNSGLGNALNPLTSLANKEVYGFPMLLMIGWRGQPGKKDEPQHSKMGAITQALLAALDIPCFILNADDNWSSQLTEAIQRTNKISHPVALVVEEDFFEETHFFVQNDYELSAEQIIGRLESVIREDDIVVCNTGKTGRLFYRINEAKKIDKYFMNVGAMGHASSIATAFAMFTRKTVFLLDGDGSLLMHMGSLAVNGRQQESDLVYILLNNGAHQSVGGQPTVGFATDFCSIARACGFERVYFIRDETDFNTWANGFDHGRQFVEIRINTEMPENLPRPPGDFQAMKYDLMKKLLS